MSASASALTFSARAFIPCGSTPAEYASISRGLSLRAHPSAIWLRHEFPVHRNSTFNFGFAPLITGLASIARLRSAAAASSCLPGTQRLGVLAADRFEPLAIFLYF